LPVAARTDAGRPDLERELARTRDELDALRQALTQEHAARVAAESGEELSRARAELARQAALLEQIKGRGTHPEG
jgi:multidrug resistance efflux pump